MSLPAVMERAQALGYKIFLTGAYNVNLIGVRSHDRTSNTFNDEMHLIYRESADGPLVEKIYRCTTDPGTYWLHAPGRSEGTAIVAPGQYRACWGLGLHRGEYPALVQVGPIAVYRDANRDGVLEMQGRPVPGLYGINLHHASATHTSTTVDKWSAGCQVIADPRDFAELLAVCTKAGGKFSYTLLDEWR